MEQNPGQEVLIKEKEAELQKASADILRAKAGEELQAELSPLEEVRKLNEETKNNIKILSELHQKMEKTAANIALGGRAFAGQKQPETKSPKDIARELGSKAVDEWYSKSYIK